MWIFKAAPLKKFRDFHHLDLIQDVDNERKLKLIPGGSYGYIYPYALGGKFNIEHLLDADVYQSAGYFRSSMLEIHKDHRNDLKIVGWNVLSSR